MAAPTFLSANVPVKVPVSIKLSESTTPVRLAPATFRVAVWLPSYTLFCAVTPVTTSAGALR